MIAITHRPSPNLQACEKTYVPWTAIDGTLAHIQHTAYCRALADLGCEVITFDGGESLADSTFVEDTAIVLDELAILASLGAESRRPETDRMRPILARFRRLESIHLPATLEGGDVLRLGRQLLVGRSRRTNLEGIESLRAILRRFDYQIVAIPVHGCLHLKTACTALPDGTLLINPHWIDPGSLTPWKTMRVPDSEPWAANVCVVGETAIIPAEHPRTIEQLRNRGIKVCPVPLSEFAKAEGGATCLSLLIDHVA